MARTKGAPHLRPASRDLPPYQLYLLDVYLLVFVILAAGSAIFGVLVYYFVARRVWRKVFGQKERRRSSNLSTGGVRRDSGR